MMDQRQPLPRLINERLQLRTARPEDAEKLADFNARIHSDDGPEKPDDKVAAWTRDLMTGKHPTFSPRISSLSRRSTREKSSPA